MKKVILALAIVSVSFAACNSGESTTEAPKDTVAAPVVADTTAPTAPAVVDTMKPAVVDTTKK
jgi:hypothetical protein